MKLYIEKVDVLGEIEHTNEFELEEGRLIISFGEGENFKSFYVNTKNGTVDEIKQNVELIQKHFLDNLL